MKMEKSALRVGWASEDVTPKVPVELCGQYYQRVSTHVRDPLLATALALESGRRESAILLTLDLAGIGAEFLELLRARLRPRMPDFDTSKLTLSVIHTHNAPQATSFFNWWTPDPRAITMEEYRSLLLDRAQRAVLRAWGNRSPAGISSAFGRAVAGHCRRAMYADGTVEMYGRTERRDFVGLEAAEDSGVEMLFCWDAQRRPTGVILNFACPAQVMEAAYCVTADFVGDLRRELRARISRDFFLLALIAPSGDQSPRDLTRNSPGEPNMWGESGAVEIARRLADAVEEGCAAASGSIRSRVSFRHEVKRLQLPLRRVSPGEYREACRLFKALQAREPRDARSPRAAFNRFVAETKANEAIGGAGPYDSKLHDFVLLRNNEAVIERYRTQAARPEVSMELHALRLGEVALATNPFELYLDYGQRIKARSPARQTFLVQLSGDYLGYLPTLRAVSGGGYGALVINGSVGPDGGDLLVEKTLNTFYRLWDK